MKGKFISLCIIYSAAMTSSILAQPNEQDIAREREQRAAMPDTTGSGPFAAMKQSVPMLTDHVIYRPANLNAMGNTQLGIYVFGNGGCTDDAASSRMHLLEIASHGYLVIAPGRIYSGPDAVERVNPEETGFDGTRPEQLNQSIDWALTENAREGSPYYNLIDPEAIAISGYSCGGVQALLNAGDQRADTMVIMNSGLYVDGNTSMAGMETNKDILHNIHTSILYVLGGPTDIAYPNGMDDYALIDHVPIAVANIDVGHGGTYWDANGGKAAQVVVKWLNWQLRGDNTAGQMFLGEACGLCNDPDWSIEKKHLD
ncbi:MAG: hypothetical protein P8J61_10450 [Gammaproteobacteria bacterium]|nr:hypothetical protein [Gammaproteobacteria bacterium]